ncbi:right-handed parallel beta-helix repeat-containing protein [Pseudomonas sp. DCB_AW]|uniref:right-handed parallel beta-helix repeat-containing protein n=1 Tax=Pseudomonas sp. DCB_AW TaxID=2993596 RepID=UPI002248B65D|nr:right-handed parallel beta-helix repeat-containing protein [Pseudomonas sp. DCB_AW]MCX2688522.1 right-handed parallel beta-helix repeat-containing protein [Pseudomonas sp. DCB_AW]
MKASALSAALLCFSSLSYASTPTPPHQCNLPNFDNGNKLIELNSECIYSDTINITQSNLTVDCNGAVLNGQHRLKSGIVINGKGEKISNITIKNCTLINYKHHALIITSGTTPKKLSYDAKRLHSIAPSNIKLNKLNIYNSGAGGVYFFAYVHNSSLTNSKISSSREAGVYLSQNTNNIEISGNIIAHNGYVSKKANRREGIAIDTSHNNKIHNNLFLENGAGGIFLYTRCGKVPNPESFSPSNYNIIYNNVFRNEPIGVWLASRQSRDLSSFKCSGTPLDESKRFFRDYADHNTIKNNQFCDGKLAVRIEGDDNTITENSYNSSHTAFSSEPYADKTKHDGLRSNGNVISNNKMTECVK